MIKKWSLLMLCLMVSLLLLSPGLGRSAEEEGGSDDDNKPLKAVPKAFANKHMPSGWWTDEKIIAEGKKIFETRQLEYEYKRKKEVAKEGCATCHSIDEKKDRPKKRGARDFRVSAKVNRFSDSYWFWRTSEGVEKTAMPAWGKELSEEEIWKVIAYEHTWSHGGKPAAHDHSEIENTVEK